MRLTKNQVFWSIVITTLFYSLIHFIGMKKIFVDSSPTFVDGLRMIGAPFLSLAQWPKFWPEAVGLFLFGLALNSAAYRSGSLYPSIGFHAGCVFFVKLDDSFLQYQTAWSFFWGSKILYDGLMGWSLLGLMALVFWLVLKPSGSAAVSIPSETSKV
jgi:membrane protease YdiL (CAAX protease family)